MKTKSALTILLIALIMSGITLFAIINLGTAQTSGTNVSGVITADTTWTSTNSPYTLTGNVLVSNGVTLTVEAGTTINLGNYFIEVNGTLKATGSSTNRISFNSGQIIFTEYSSNWNDQTTSGCIITQSTINSSISLKSSPLISNDTISGAIDVARGTPTISYNTLTGGITVDANAIVSNNTILNKGLYLVSNALAYGNTIMGCSVGITLPNLNVNAPSVIRNLIVNNTDGIEIIDEAVNGAQSYNPIITNNTITSNNVGIWIIEQILPSTISPIITYNNMYANKNYNINSAVTYDINSTYNWWGTTDSQVISQTIYDYNNDFNLGHVTYSPYLAAQNSQAPTYVNATAAPGGSISPSGVINLNSGGSQTFTITPNTGYHIADVSVNGTLVGAVSSYIVQNVNGATTISATFALNPTPTPTATPSPTATSTNQPTSNPTTNPTSNPTAQPTTNPTTSPTATPIISPSPTAPEFPIWIMALLPVAALVALAIVKIRIGKKSR